MLWHGDIGRLVERTSAQDNDERVVFRGGRLFRVDLNEFLNIVVVKSADDLLNIDSTKTYMIDGVVDMGSQSIEVPTGGMSIAGMNGARDTSKLISSADNYTMFTSPAGSYSGDVVLESLTIEVTGTSSKVFNLDNDGNSNAVEATGVNFVSCTSLGELTDYRQVLMDIMGFISVADGLTFSGTWSGGIALLNSIAVNFPAATLLKEGTSLTMTNLRSNINFLSVNSSAVLCDFQESNITTNGGFFLNGVRTTATDAVPNLPSTSTKARIRDSIGLENTYIGGNYVISSTAATTISMADTPYKVAGTTTYSGLTWFTGSNNNEFVYAGDEKINIVVFATLSFSGTANDEISAYIRKYDDSAGSYVDIAESGRHTMNAGGRAEGVSIHGFTEVENGDRIEIWVENYTGARNVTASLDGNVSINER